MKSGPFHEDAIGYSWIGTLQGFLTIFVDILIRPIFDKENFRHLIFPGTIFVVFGIMMTSLYTT